MPTIQGVWVIDVRLDAQPDAMRATRKLVSAVARAMGATRAVAFELEIALGEALANAYAHAYGARGKGRIAIRLACGDESLTATVKDRGGRLRSAPVTPEDVPLTRRRGRGFFLMSRLMDDVEVIHPVRAGRGTAVRMTKRLRAGSTQSTAGDEPHGRHGAYGGPAGRTRRADERSHRREAGPHAAPSDA